MEHLPALPIPLAHMSGYLLNEVMYIAGGQQSMSEPEALKVFLKLDLSEEGSEGFGWEELGSWPGPARAFSVMTAQGDGESDCVFLFSVQDLLSKRGSFIAR